MIDFKAKLPRWEIHDNEGNLVNVRELPDKSITTEAMANEFLSIQHFVDSYMKALDDKMLLIQFMKHLEIQAGRCVEESKSDKQWDSAYSTSIVYYLDNLLERYANIFKKYNIDTTYSTQPEIKSLYTKAIEEASVSVSGSPILDLSEIKFYGLNPDIRANTAGFKALITYYTDEQFIEQLSVHLHNCTYSSNQTNLWIIITEVINRLK